MGENAGFFPQVDLDFHLEELFPELPSLRASARAGCAFCQLLRNVMLSESVKTDISTKLNELESKKLSMSLSYWWNTMSDVTPRPRLSLLSLDLEYGMVWLWGT